MAEKERQHRPRKRSPWRSGFAVPVLVALLQTGCSEGWVPAPRSSAVRREHVILDRLLALPLEELITALGNKSIWRVD